jgi:hypothetical protein
VPVKPAFELPPLTIPRVTLPGKACNAGDAGMEAAPRFVRHMAIVLVDDSGPSTMAALQHARSLRATTIRAVHFVLDSQQAEQLRADWPPDARVPLELVDCPGQSLARCAVDLIRHEAEQPDVEVTVIMSRRRSFAPSGRTGIALPGGMPSQIAQELGQLPHVAVSILAPPRAASEPPGP